MKRIVGGLDMFALAVKELPDKKRFLNLYSQYWKEFAPNAGKEFFSVKELAAKYRNRYEELMKDAGDFYRKWGKGLREEMRLASREQTAYPDVDTAERMILSSQIHMTNNRLGIVPQLEAPLAEVLQVCEGS